MYLLWLLRLFKWFTYTLVGPIVYISFPKDWEWKSRDNRGYGRFTNSFVDSIWGNSIDGLSGDTPYRNNEATSIIRRFWPSFWWTCVRNPANNYIRTVVEPQEITYIERTGHITIVDFAEQRLVFFYTPDWPVMFKIGYKLWPNDPSLKVGNTYSPKLAFSIQRGNKIQ